MLTPVARCGLRCMLHAALPILKAATFCFPTTRIVQGSSPLHAVLAAFNSESFARGQCGLVFMFLFFL